MSLSEREFARAHYDEASSLVDSETGKRAKLEDLELELVALLQIETEGLQVTRCKLTPISSTPC